MTIYICEGELTSCTVNPFNSRSICNFCKFRSYSALEAIESNVIVKKLLLERSNKIIDQKVFDSLELGVMSSIASAVKAQSAEQLNSKWKGVHRNMLVNAQLLYTFFLSEIAENKYDYLFMFNGRFGDVKPALEAAKTAGISFGLYDVKKSLHEVVFVDELVHSIRANTERALISYVKNPKIARKNAAIFFAKKEKKEDTGDPTYTKNQMAGELPDQIKNTTKKIVAIYPTTDDEYKFIGQEWDGYVPDDQVLEIGQLAEMLSSKDYIIVVKMHPNQATTAEQILDRYLALQKNHPHVIIEEPLSKKDTYALMHKADYVINFASTIGVEACFARKIVIAIGDTTFSKMNIAYKTKSGIEAGSLILRGGLKPKSIRGAIIWGNYLYAYADRLPSFSRESNGDYRVNGLRIGHSKFLRALQLPAKLKLEVSKPGFRFGIGFLISGLHIIQNIVRGKWSVK